MTVVATGKVGIVANELEAWEGRVRMVAVRISGDEAGLGGGKVWMVRQWMVRLF